MLGVWVAGSESDISWGEVFSALSRRGWAPCSPAITKVAARKALGPGSGGQRTQGARALAALPDAHGEQVLAAY